MDTYTYTYPLEKPLKKGQAITVGVAGSGNLEVIIKPGSDSKRTEFIVKTVVTGFKPTWDAVIERFVEDYPFGGLSFTLNDAGATPPVVSLRLRQAIETYQTGYREKENYLESSARARIYSLVDKESFQEFLLTNEDAASPNLPALNMQTEADDGVVIGAATLNGNKIAIISQQKDFIGGSVGEVHGAKINGLIKYAIKHQLEAIVFLIDSGGVRLHEANVGEIEISEIIRSLLEAKSAGVKTIGVVCGSNGAYGGMGIISGILDYLIVNQVARIGVSGAEVIQAVKGAEVFDSSNRSLVWRVYGGRTRYLQQAVQDYTTNKVQDIRASIIKAMIALNNKPLINVDLVAAEQEALMRRIRDANGCSEEGEWLEKNQPDLSKQDIFNIQDSQFLTLIKSRR
ncbi:biotin-independent malonate decarboxylase subunit beta [Legionella oakridgensis]|uniref:Malonate decarboxylase acyl carrier protein n=2 Tax=Legionella oakridgensis TaxID=29423 RepID=W0BGN3_9GAMM|nr:malonate decarboxylase acyl carrier protein/malonate decarboxylase, beta subunit [Legionella oakridgensis ATCC 33761 = DSM 21215]ETO92834.1 malonate decarboxylase acyl carrier protein/malonate decarboxylase, beta subunit [Legionella oakridgensis RV-2-2007]KTD37059.1 acetyl coenzyme A carboxylase, carboxyltransferase subunit beta [Legionella oakridgensis]STY20632.1 acetyl coenzyme A carboxylase, carboxyltransferase subunit beta [Legionella longbeachae]